MLRRLCKSSQPQRILGKYLPPKCSLNCGCFTESGHCGYPPPLIPLQRFSFSCVQAPSDQNPSMCESGGDSLTLSLFSFRSASLTWKEQLFTLADLQLPMMLRLACCANSSLWSDVRSHPQSSLVSWVRANKVDVEDLMFYACSDFLWVKVIECIYYLKDFWLFWNLNSLIFDYIRVIPLSFVSAFTEATRRDKGLGYSLLHMPD